MRIAFVGAGAMGSSYGGLLALAGFDVTLIDVWAEHVEAINARGLRLTGVKGEHLVRVAAVTEPTGRGWADVVVVFTDANATAQAAETARAIRAPDGFAITFQNGIGNVERLVEVVGAGHVLGGSSMCSAMISGPGEPRLTHLGPTSLGELDGAVPARRNSARAAAFAEALERAGFEVRIEADITAKIWSKFVINAAINAICATSGLRLGEVVRLPELDELQSRVIDEVLAVVAAKGIQLPDPDIKRTIKAHCRVKFSRPSMLQHVEAGRRTEIDAINGALVREARALGIPVPYNEALAALLKGRERREQQRAAGVPIDYEALEAQARAAAQS